VNTKERGDVAAGQAVAYFMGNGYEVCLPIGDKRNYDFLVEQEGRIQRVQVKYAGLYGGKQCKVGLRITGGNQSYNYSKKYSADAFDILFVYTANGSKYALPWSEVECRNELAIECGKYEKYRVN
jgi:hypothetical protein